MHEPFAVWKLNFLVIGLLIAVAIWIFVTFRCPRSSTSTARKRPRWGVPIALVTLLVAGMFSVYLVRGGRVGGRHAPGPVPYPAGRSAVVSMKPATALVERADLAFATHRIEAPNDFSAWARDGILGFQPPCAWLPAEAEPRDEIIGDTEFVYWEPVKLAQRSCLLGLSEQEPEREAAYLGARRSAEAKLAVLALVVLKREDRRADAASAHPLALRLARKFYKEEAKHLEKARRSYGDVYRAAVVARAGSTEVNGLASEVEKELARGWVQRQRAMTSWLLAIGAALVIGFAIFLFYTFANAGTKGYFAWPLRLASFALFVLLCAGLFYLRVRLGAG